MSRIIIMNLIRNRQLFIMGAVALVLIIISGCQGSSPVETPVDEGGQVRYGPGSYENITIDVAGDVGTKQFASEEGLLDFIRENAGGRYFGRSSVRLLESQAMVREADEFGSWSVKAIAPAPGDFSQTNVQVAGVDEADILKTDGTYIYTVSGSTLFIILAYPGADAKIVSTIKFDSRPEGLFIDGDHLAVFGNFYNLSYFDKMGFRPRYGMSFFYIYDVSDRENPQLVEDYKFEGRYFRGRMMDGYVYLVTSSVPEYRVDYPTPVIFEGAAMRSIPLSDVYYYDIRYEHPVFVNIHAVNLRSPSDDINSKVITVESSQNLYMSDKNIYITYTERINEYELQRQVMQEILEPKLTKSDRELIEKIKRTDNDVLSRSEKESKIFKVYEDRVAYLSFEEQEALGDKAEALLKTRLDKYKYFEYTVINKVSVDGGKIVPEANGKVPGHIINQFSLDEKDGILRIATTISPRWSRFDGERTRSTNNVYTLGSDLEILDELDGLGEGERIYSTRFIGDRLYMVTFKQVDPFFVIDLGNPREIKELGKLKIPGFSKYLHPYDNDTIIGIGKEATETGRVKGLKISLFDVSDVEHPKEIAKYTTKSRYANSNALYEHKAFLFSKDKNLLVIPVYSYGYPDGSQSYNGAFVFEIKKDSIKLRGLIDHSQGGGRRYAQPSVERSLYIEDLLYTKSAALLRINRLEDLGDVKDLKLKSGDMNVKEYGVVGVESFGS